MTLCSNGQKAIIQWQYPGEDKQQIIGADSYSVEQINKNFDGYPCQSSVQWRADPNPGTPATNVLTGTLVFEVERGEYVKIKQDKLPGNSACPHIPQRIWITNFDRVLLDYAATCHTLSIVNQTIICRNCTLTVTKNGQTVYTKTRSVCPVVTHSCGEQCPDGSCECTCGTEICCYHPATGAIVKSFTR